MTNWKNPVETQFGGAALDSACVAPGPRFFPIFSPRIGSRAGAREWMLLRRACGACPRPGRGLYTK